MVRGFGDLGELVVGVRMLRLVSIFVLSSFITLLLRWLDLLIGLVSFKISFTNFAIM